MERVVAKVGREVQPSMACGAWLALAAMLWVSGGCSHAPSTQSTVACAETNNHHDGDTFTCVPDRQASSFIVRVASIDAPETGQAYWRVARARLRELAAPSSLVDCYKVDRYERRVCRLKTKDGRDAAALMLSEGLAWYSEDFASEDKPADRERYRRLQDEARTAKRGLWPEPDPMPPKVCRQRWQIGASRSNQALSAVQARRAVRPGKYFRVGKPREALNARGSTLLPETTDRSGCCEPRVV